MMPMMHKGFMSGCDTMATEWGSNEHIESRGQGATVMLHGQKSKVRLDSQSGPGLGSGQGKIGSRTQHWNWDWDWNWIWVQGLGLDGSQEGKDRKDGKD